MDTNERKTPSQGDVKKPPRKREAEPVRNRETPRKGPAGDRPAGKASRPREASAAPRAQERRTERAGEADKKRQSPRPSEKNTGTAKRAPEKTSARTPEKSRPVPARQSGKKQAPRQSGDSGYQPYKAANQRKKETRKGKTRKFFSGENPAYKSLAGFLEGMRTPRAGGKTGKKKKSRFDTPAVVYTQPKAFNRNRLLVQLLTVLAVVAALVMGLSVFFRVKVVTVSGAEVYSAWTIREASDISEGDNLLTFSRARASGQILAKLPYVKTARIGIKLPDTVNIEIEEENVVYAIQSEDGVWWLMTSGGKVVEQTTSTGAESYTQVLGVTIASPQAGELAVAAEAAQTVPTTTEETGETVSVTITGARRLSAAMEILTALEDNDIVGQAASVDVSQLDDIILWYGTQYQVNLGDANNIAYKIAAMNDAILQLGDYEDGILDASFTTWPDQIAYTPFE